MYRTISLRFVVMLSILFGVRPLLGQQQEFRLAPLISENMVIQRESDVRLWGWGKPGTDVRIQSSWQATATARVQEDGTWLAQLRSPKAGGPFQIMFTHAEGTVTLQNVLSGEVWLCSGQSNMEMTLTGWPPTDTVRNSAAEIARSANPNIRMFTVQRAYSSAPEFTAKGEWQESSPATSPNFSATAYFFGKKLHEALGVPVGLLVTSWSGTAVHSWISARYLSGLPQFTETLAQLRGGEEGQRQLISWLSQFPVIDMAARQGADRWKNLDFGDAECSAREYDDSPWRTMNLPSLWELAELGILDGAVWFRKRVELPAAWVGKNLTLRVGQIDDMDATYVNGVLVGSQEERGHWRDERVYRVPASLVNDRTLQIAVRVVDNQGGGGIYGNPETLSLMADGSAETLSLAGEWKYHVAALYRQNVFHVFGQQNEYGAKPKLALDMDYHLPTVLYNGMVAPVVLYTIRGAIWYQGESDTGNPEQYRTLFPLMIQNWRNDFKLGDFPFYFVQISPFDYGTNTNSGFLREAQTQSLSVKNTGMAVTLDIGNATNIHPANKQDVGDRLARCALTKTYGKNVAYSGPMYVSMKHSGSALELTFDHAEGGLVLRSPAGFQIAGADRVFKDATVRVDGMKLIVSHPDIAPPEAVRYAFTNTPDATLFNADGLPAPSFRTDQWK